VVDRSVVEDEGDTPDVASHSLKRTMRGALAASAVVVAVSITPIPATAAPTPTTSSDAAAQYDALAKQADALNDKIDTVNVNIKAQQALEQKSNADIAKSKAAAKAAQGKEDQFRGQVDQLADASFEGARLNQLSALLTGTSMKDFLDRATDLQDLAANNEVVLDQYNSAVSAATQAETKAENDLKTAQDAVATQNALKAQLAQQSVQLDAQIAALAKAKAKLSASEQASLRDEGVAGTFIAPVGSGVRGEAMEIALDQRGKEYVWAAAGPSTFDCSGLVVYSYAQAGDPGLPHSSEELSTMGTAVSRANLQPGDLVFFGAPVHHVGIYVGNDLMVDAPQTGEVVKVQTLNSDYSGARRF
jgi:cell wall-associated NlpC family hydrolase